MNSNYHTTDTGRQSLTADSNPGVSLTAQLAAERSTKSLPLPTTFALTHPTLVGDREMLRRLRAAEMAAWESVRPKTAVESVAAEKTAARLWRSVRRGSLWGENLPFLLLASCAGAAVLIGLGDVSELLNQWSQFVQGIGRLLQ